MSHRSTTLAQRLRGLLLVCMAALVAAPAAFANDGAAVWADCADDGLINGKHSQSALSAALANAPADAAEYTDCGDQIRAAQLGASAGGGSAGGGDTATGAAAGGGGPAIPPDALQDALAQRGLSISEGETPGAPTPAVNLGGEEINLGEGSLPSFVGALSLPLPLAASAVVVLLVVALPIVRYVIARLGPNSAAPTAPAG